MPDTAGALPPPATGQLSSSHTKIPAWGRAERCLCPPDSAFIQPPPHRPESWCGLAPRLPVCNPPVHALSGVLKSQPSSGQQGPVLVRAQPRVTFRASEGSGEGWWQERGQTAHGSRDGRTTASWTQAPSAALGPPGCSVGWGGRPTTQSPGEQGSLSRGQSEHKRVKTLLQGSRASRQPSAQGPGNVQAARGKTSQTTDSAGGEGGQFCNHVSPRREGIHLRTTQIS